MSKTISSATTTGVTLTAAYDPLVITSAGSITVGNGLDAVYGGSSQAWEVENAGRLQATSDSAVELNNAALVTNTGTIIDTGATGRGIRIAGGAGTVTNNGLISAGQAAVVLGAAGTVTNFGTISATASNGYGVDVGGFGTVTNSGTITAGENGVRLRAGGTVINQGSIGATGASGVGVYLGGGPATLTNAGTISGAADAVKFSGSYADRVILDPAAVFDGTVVAGNPPAGQTNTLELTSSFLPIAGTLSGHFSQEFVGFGSIVVDHGASWQIAANSLIDGAAVTDSGRLSNAGTIAGVNVTVAASGTLINTGALLIADAGGAVTLVAGGVVENNGSNAQLNGRLGDGVDATGGSAVVTNGGTIVGKYYGVSLNSGGTVTNTGTISSYYDAGVFIAGNGATVTNTGTIAGGSDGVGIKMTGTVGDRVILGAGSVIDGTVQGSVLGIQYNYPNAVLELAPGRAGVTGTLSGFATNFTGFGTIAVDAGASWVLDSSNTIHPHYGVTDAGTLTNAGNIWTPVTVTGSGTFINTSTVTNVIPQLSYTTLTSGGVVDNAAGASMESVYVSGGPGTITNAGVIRGSTVAVSFAGAYADRVIVDPGAEFGGTVQGGTGTNVLELAAGTVGATGTLSGVGSEFTNFGTITIDDDASWELAGATTGQAVTLGSDSLLEIGTPGSFTDAIGGFDASNALDLLGLPFVIGATASISGDVLSVESGGVTDTLTVTGVPADTALSVTDDGSAMNGSMVEFLSSDYQSGGGLSNVGSPCYCRGTRIRTDRGEVAVEDLSIGDRVVTASGASRPIRWIGRRSHAGRFLAANPKNRPIRFAAGSLGRGLPHRDLLVSPNHAMFVGGLLIPAACLVNGDTIAQDRCLTRVDYYHVELDSHDLLLAEGTPSESFLDDDSRGMFENAHECPPDAARQDGYCARRVEQGAELEAIRRRLAGVAREVRRAA
jgi:hypothetical protein